MFELTFESGEYSYRAYRFEWKQDTGSPPTDAPAAALLSQNYPNPFNGLTTIYLQLSNPGRVSLKVFDLLGREVETVIQDEPKVPGTYRMTLNMERFTSGVYFYRLTTGSKVITRRMLLVR